jgi:hypothetical protein
MTEHANGVVVDGGKVFTIAHFLMNKDKFRIIDVPTRKETQAAYIYRDTRCDVGELDLTCNGPSFETAEPRLGEQVVIKFYDYNGIDFTHMLTSGVIYDTFAVAGHERYAIQTNANKLLCGSAVTNVGGQLLGLINTRIDRHGMGDILYAFTNINEVL